MGKSNLHRLFHDGDLELTLLTTHSKIPQKVSSIPRDQFLNSSTEELKQYLILEFSIDPLVIYEDRKVFSDTEKNIDVSRFKERNPFNRPGPMIVPGIEITITIPYSGESSLWDLRPNQYLGSSSPYLTIVKQIGPDGLGYIEIVVSQPTDEPLDKLKILISEELKAINFYIGAQLKQLEKFNTGLPALIEEAILDRRKRLKKHESISDSIGIPLKQRDGSPFFEPLKLTRKMVRPLPPPPKSGFQPEPGILDQDFRHILNVIRHVGRTFEQTQKTYAVHDEQELRDIILANLNGHYEGTATGETFRGNGKTDIRIEDQNRAAFVAECKIWTGEDRLSDGIDQLLGYLTWRDCKDAFIIFNKHRKNFSQILERIPETFESHENFRHKIDCHESGEWEFLMTSKEDESRSIRIRVFAFNLYVSS